jgi:hypothetical protein
LLIGQVGYGLAALAFALFALLALTSWRGRLQGGLLVAASTLTAAWAATAALANGDATHWQTVAVLEILRNALWLVFVARLTPAGQGIDGLPHHLAPFAPAALVGVSRPTVYDLISRHDVHMETASA